MAWDEEPLAVLDLEATGVEVATARIIEIALLLVDSDGVPTVLTEGLVDPGFPLPERVTAITGITTADLTDRGRPPAEVLSAARAEIDRLVAAGTPIVIYRATYDWPLLAAECARHGLGRLPAVPPAILVDPLVLDRHVDRYRKGKRTLGVVAEHYRVPFEGAHRARADALAAVAVARRIARTHPEVRVDAEALVELQRRAHETWKRSFNAHLARIGAARPPVTEVWPTG